MKKIIIIAMMLFVVGILFCDHYYVKVKSDVTCGSVTIKLHKSNGATMIATARYVGVYGGWRKYQLDVDDDWQPGFGGTFVTAEATVNFPLIGTFVRTSTFYSTQTSYCIGYIEAYAATDPGNNQM